MRAPKAIATAAACCAVAASAFQSSVVIRPEVRSRQPSSLHADAHRDLDLEAGPLGASPTEGPRSLGPKSAFLGMRRESGVMRRMMEQQRQREGPRVGQTALASSPTALMPDGGLSPCVIKVLGVGGGGSNAVSCYLRC